MTYPILIVLVRARRTKRGDSAQVLKFDMLQQIHLWNKRAHLVATLTESLDPSQLDRIRELITQAESQVKLCVTTDNRIRLFMRAELTQDKDDWYGILRSTLLDNPESMVGPGVFNMLTGKRGLDPVTEDKLSKGRIGAHVFAIARL